MYLFFIISIAFNFSIQATDNISYWQTNDDAYSCPYLNFNQSEFETPFWEVRNSTLSETSNFIKSYSDITKSFKISYKEYRVQGKPYEIDILGNEKNVKVFINVGNFYKDEQLSLSKRLEFGGAILNFDLPQQRLTIQSPKICLQNPSAETQEFLQFCYTKRLVPYCFFQLLAQNFSAGLVNFLKENAYIEKWMFLSGPDNQKSLSYPCPDHSSYDTRILNHLENLEKHGIIKNRTEHYFILKKFINYFEDKLDKQFSLVLPAQYLPYNIEKNYQILSLLKQHFSQLPQFLTSDPIMVPMVIPNSVSVSELNLLEKDKVSAKKTSPFFLPQTISKFLKRIRYFFNNRIHPSK